MEEDGEEVKSALRTKAAFNEKTSLSMTIFVKASMHLSNKRCQKNVSSLRTPETLDYH